MTGTVATRSSTSSTRRSAARPPAGRSTWSQPATIRTWPATGARRRTTRSSRCRRWPTTTASPAASQAPRVSHSAAATATTRSPISATTASTSTSPHLASVSGRRTAAARTRRFRGRPWRRRTWLGRGPVPRCASGHDAGRRARGAACGRSFRLAYLERPRQNDRSVARRVLVRSGAGLRLRSSTTSVGLQSGTGSLAVKLRLTRLDGLADPATLSAENLPDGLTPLSHRPRSAGGSSARPRSPPGCCRR